MTPRVLSTLLKFSELIVFYSGQGFNLVFSCLFRDSIVLSAQPEIAGIMAAGLSVSTSRYQSTSKWEIPFLQT